MPKITVYIDDEIHQELVNIMVSKARSLTYIVDEMIRQAIREKKRKSKNIKNGTAT
jgi:predicted transcriptional regulator